MLSTRYQSSVIDVPESPPKSGLFVIKAATTNKKLGSSGKLIQKGPFRGLPLYSLTLEERATCWDQCPNLELCYGDNMPFAKRHRPGPALENAIAHDLELLNQRHRQGFVVRLHVLGDFYSVEYVRSWETFLKTFPAMRVFGYTHWPLYHPIGKEVTRLVQHHVGRVSILRSDKSDPADPLPGAMTIAVGATAFPGTVVCPEQTGKTAACTTCGLCMNGRTAVSFVDHSRKALTSRGVAA
jgi:hypothetical protein